GHFQFGLDLALAVKTADPVWFFSELDKAKVWPPLHGLVLSATLLVAGTDHRWATVPSLIGWILTIVFSFLIVRRMFADRIQSIYAGAVTVVFVMTSPALRLLSSDVMLEGLGAGLSAAALWALLRADADRNDTRKWRLLALILTALFFEKGNYWGLVVASL